MLRAEAPLRGPDDVGDGHGERAQRTGEGGAQRHGVGGREAGDGVEEGLGCVGAQEGREGVFGAWGWGGGVWVCVCV